MLGEIEQTLANLAQMQGKTGQHLVDNEWLASIRSRAVIPGGTCKFDLPSYYAWQQWLAEQRRYVISRSDPADAAARDAVTIVLRLARESGQASKVMAMQAATSRCCPAAPTS